MLILIVFGNTKFSSCMREQETLFICIQTVFLNLSLQANELSFPAVLSLLFSAS